MPPPCSRGESSRPSEDPGCAWIQRKVEAQRERENCFAPKMPWLQQVTKSAFLCHPPTASSHSLGDGGLL